MAIKYSLVVTANDSDTPVSTDATKTALQLRNAFSKLSSGHNSGAYSVACRTAAVAASGTVTLANASVADTVTIAGVVFTAVASGATGDQFNQGGTDTADADSLVTAINASSSAGITGCVTASNNSGVVTITASQPGSIGNAITLASSNGTRLAVSGARLASGAETLTTHTY